MPKIVNGEVICWPCSILLTEIPIFWTAISSSGPVEGWFVMFVAPFTRGLAVAELSGKLFFGGVGRFVISRSIFGVTCD